MNYKQMMIMKKIFILLFLMFCISGCAFNETSMSVDLSELFKEEPNTAVTPLETPGTPSVTAQTQEFNIEGTFICTGVIISSTKFFFFHSENIPHITFYENGTCKIRANYNEGLREMAGEYIANADSIFVKLDSQDLFVQEDWEEMDAELVFDILSDDEIIIDRQFYAVLAGDPFTRLTLASIEQGNPGSIKTGVVVDGFTQYTATRPTTTTKEWITFEGSPLYDILRFTIMLPEEYEMNNFFIYKENGFPNVEEWGIIRSPVKLKNEQQMPSNVETLQKYEEAFWAENESRYEPGSFLYYSGEMVSFGGKNIFIAHRDVGASYLHAFYMTVDDYVFRFNFLSQKKYLETELLDLYVGIISSIEIVKVIKS